MMEQNSEVFFLLCKTLLVQLKFPLVNVIVLLRTGCSGLLFFLALFCFFFLFQIKSDLKNLRFCVSKQFNSKNLTVTSIMFCYHIDHLS